MKITVASGKGGTGKTTVATSLALSVKRAQPEAAVHLMDCDVEAPNAHLYLHPTIGKTQEAAVRIPVIDEAICTACGKCVSVCEFHALAQIGKKVLVFPQLCHGCGSCTWNCPEKAISEAANPIGMLEAGTAIDDIQFSQGILTISEPMASPVIRQLKAWIKPAITASPDMTVIIDAPPGASCSVVETVRGSDFILLVTEPTPFGLHDLKQMIGITREMGIPAGVIINRDGIGDQEIGDQEIGNYCAGEGLPILMRIPFERAVAEGLSAGKPLVEIRPGALEEFVSLFHQIRRIVKGRS